jgi:hypothetical protein
VPVAGAQTSGPVQPVVAVTTRQPLTIPQVIWDMPSVEQEVPGPAVQAAGTCGQAQVAPGKVPEQVVGEVQVVVLTAARQPLPSRPHFSSLPPEQSVPALVHSDGGAGHDPQVAEPAVPVQGWLHDVAPVWTRQPAGSSAQVTTDLLLVGSQNVPAALQAAGLAGH